MTRRRHRLASSFFRSQPRVAALESRIAPAQLVVTNLDDSGNGSLRDAIAKANSPNFPGEDTITFNVTGTILLTSGQLEVNESLIIQGPGAKTLTIDGNNSSRVFRLSDGPVALTNVRINDLSITGGNTSVDGGAIENFASFLTLTRTHVFGNAAGGRGGAISTISAYAVVSIFDSTLRSNLANTSGGAIHIAVNNVNFLMVNSTVSGNTALTGGGIYAVNLYGGIEIQNSTIVGNTATTFAGGGGIRFAYPSLPTAQKTFASTIVSGNNNNFGTPDINTIDGPISANFCAFGDTSGFTFVGSNNLINQAFSLSPLADNGGPTPTHAIPFFSPLIDAGSNPLNLVNDQRGIGFARTLGNGTDIGAFEFDPPPFVIDAFASIKVINDYSVGKGQLMLTAEFSEPMNTGIAPTFSFPANNDPGAALTNPSGQWLANNQYRVTYDVVDTDIERYFIDLSIAGAKDVAGNVMIPQTIVNVFTIDTVAPEVTSILRADPNPTNAASVNWAATFSEPVSGVTADNFTLFNGGLTGPLGISTVTGGGQDWNVRATTGSGQGTLAVYAISAAGVTDIAGNYLTKLPVISETFSIDHVAPQVNKITTSALLINDASAGPTGFSVTVTYNEPMHPLFAPLIDFPVEDPFPTLFLNPAESDWSSPTEYVAKFNVVDVNLALDDVDIRVVGGADAAGNVAASITGADVFDIDMQNPIVLQMIQENPPFNNLAEVSWTLTFSESITGLTASNLSLINNGLTGTPAITDVTDVSAIGHTWTVKASTGGGQGTLGLNVVNGVGVTDANGNLLAAFPVVGPSYYIDHVAPRIEPPTINTQLITDQSVGPNGLQITVPFDELMDQSVFPVIGFPNADVSSTLTLVSQSWLDAQNFIAVYAVADAGVNISGVDLHVSGARDVVGNVQDEATIADVLTIDTKNSTVDLVQVNDGAVQRSMVRSVVVEFSEIVSFVGDPAVAFQLNGKFGNVQLNVDLSNSTADKTIARLTFGGASTEFGSLKDGRYTLTVFGSTISDSVGNAFDGNGDNVAGDDHVLASSGTSGVFRLFGDGDGNATVNMVDFMLFLSAYGGSSTIFDFDGSGGVGTLDFKRFAARFGSSI